MASKRPCHNLARGWCKYGAKCKFSHETGPAAPTKFTRPKLPCHQLIRTGHCSAGNHCRFSHEIAVDGQAAKDQLKTYDALKRWRSMLARTSERIVPLSENELAKFFEQALQLIESGRDNMQDVITDLAKPEGLVRLRQFLKQEWGSFDISGLSKTIPVLLTLFKILSHETVCQSAVIEIRHGNLLYEVYGIGGQQAATIFSTVVRYLTEQESHADVELVVAVFACMLQKTDVGMVEPRLQSTAEVLLSLVPRSTAPSRSTQRYIRTIATKLQLATRIEVAQPIAAEGRPGPKASFKVAQDLPGSLSNDGRRHDNDHEDICDIAILPTADEIISARSEYLPSEDPHEWHMPGLKGLIDRHFRLVREDTVGQLRDAVKAVLDPPKRSTTTVNQTAARTNVYRELLWENVVFDNQKGLLFVLSFDQPTNVKGKGTEHRRTWWEDSGRLAPQSLICLASTTDASSKFLLVHSPTGRPQQDNDDDAPVHERYTLAGRPTRSFVIAELTTSDPQDASNLVKSLKSPVTMAGALLVEFPGVALPTFGPTLKALQTMSRTEDMPFAEILVPGQQEPVLQPPAYSQKANFKFDLRCLLTENAADAPPSVPGSSHDMESTLDRTSLDDAQKKAVSHALTSSMALIQGPPGTGKSFTGVKLLLALLANKTAASLGPIVCVCFTNHALDQLLEHLVDAGVKQMVRVGSRSKSERLASINLRTLARSSEATRMERQERWALHNAIAGTGIQIPNCIDRMVGSEAVVMDWLGKYESTMHLQLVGTDEDGFTRATGKKTAFQSWLDGGDRQQRSRKLQQLLATRPSLFTLTHHERATLHAHWASQATQEASSDLEIHLRSFYDDRDSLDSIRGEQDLRILESASVIGITTTGLARSLKHLRKLNSKVLIVEEAGEVLEAHLLTALLPSLEHTVLIGDHQQLRPKVANYDFSVENPGGHLALDVSLFERLVRPRTGNAHGLPYVTLEMQRRMHPSVSQLIRSTLYPSLVDGPNVAGYPNVAGMRRRLFWFDHEKNEDGQDQHAQSTSHTNGFEVEMVTALVHYLQRQGVYSASDIAVLTPYLGQLRKLRQRLSSVANVVLGDRDADELKATHNSSEEEEQDSLAQILPRPSIAKGNLIDTLRLATVDNFQGEEAKVVIISLVRSNKQRKCGFLRTPNRINVLLSRAKHGMYIIGNSTTSATVPMWNDVIGFLRAGGNIGSTLELACSRHPETPMTINEPDDFNIVAPQAGCSLMCGKQLHCGHSCPMQCHSEALHTVVHCMKDCPRIKIGCEHPCTRVCGDECEKQCTDVVDCNIQLACGHRVSSLPCYLYQDPSKIVCEVPVEKVVPGCGHKIMLECRLAVKGGTFQCKQPCSTVLECGHNCQKMCYMCTRRDAQGECKSFDHGICRAVCGKPFTSCEHSCAAFCHGDDKHPLCQAPCTISCAHSKCPKKCSEPCTPCTEEKCPSSCPHASCNLPCSAPCSWVPCSRRCEELLDCQHQCPSMCGEVCPPVAMCQICASEDVKNTRVDLLTFNSYHEVDLDSSPCLFLPCGHIFTAETLDMQFEMNLDYEVDEANLPVAVRGGAEPLSAKKMKNCPDCRGSLRSIARYGRAVRRSLLDINTLKFIVWSNRIYTALAERLQQEQARLLASNRGARLASYNVNVNGDLPKALKTLGNRYNSILQLRTDIQVFLRDVRKEEQPYQKVHNIVKAARRRQLLAPHDSAAMEDFEFDNDVLQTRGELLATALMMRCDLIVATDLEDIRKELQGARDFRMQVDFNKNRNKCLDLLAAARKSKNIQQQAEASIFWAHFAAIEWYTVNTNGPEMHRIQELEVLKREAGMHLDSAQALCKQYPGQTKNVSHEVDAVHKMFSGTVSASEMRMVVAAMEKEFSGTGHWYYCANRHPFTIGECGMPMEEARCPQCSAQIGGRSHRAVEGVSHARDIEANFGRMQI